MEEEEKQRKQNTGSRWVWIAKHIPAVLLILAVVSFLSKDGLGRINRYLALISQHRLFMVLVIMALYVLKSVSFGIPFAFLYVCVGTLFEFGWALLINTCGILLNLQIPYWVGRHVGRPVVDRLIGRYPYLKQVDTIGRGSGLFTAFTMKFVWKISSEITSMLVGSMHIAYGQYLLGSFLGLLPTMIVTTFIGSTVTEPLSAPFFLSVALFIGITVYSLKTYQKNIHSDETRSEHISIPQ